MAEKSGQHPLGFTLAALVAGLLVWALGRLAPWLLLAPGALRAVYALPVLAAFLGAAGGPAAGAVFALTASGAVVYYLGGPGAAGVIFVLLAPAIAAHTCLHRRMPFVKSALWVLGVSWAALFLALAAGVFWMRTELASLLPRQWMELTRFLPEGQRVHLVQSAVRLEILPAIYRNMPAQLTGSLWYQNALLKIGEYTEKVLRTELTFVLMDGGLTSALLMTLLPRLWLLRRGAEPPVEVAPFEKWQLPPRTVVLPLLTALILLFFPESLLPGVGNTAVLLLQLALRMAGLVGVGFLAQLAKGMGMGFVPRNALMVVLLIFGGFLLGQVGIVALILRARVVVKEREEE